MKIFIFISFYFLIFGFSGSFNVFAGCRTCTKSPKNIELYLDVMKDLIEILPVLPEEKEILGTGGKVENPKKRLQESNKNAKKMQEKILIPYLSDSTKIYSDFKIQYKTAAYRRDFKKLSEIQEMIADRVLLMSLASKQNKRVSKKDLEKMDELLKKLGYLSLQKKQNGTYLFDFKSIEYKDLAKFMWKLGQMYIVFHKEKFRYRNYLKEVGTGYLKIENDDTDIASEAVEDENLTIMIADSLEVYDSFYKVVEDESVEKIDFTRYIHLDSKTFGAHIWQIHDDYACAVGLSTDTCNVARQTVRKEMSYLKKKTTKDSRNARNTFITSRKRLMGAFGIGDNDDKIAAKQREESLLHSYRGTDTPTKDKRRDIVNVEKDIDPRPMSAKATWKEVSRGWKSMANSVKSIKRKRTERRAAKDLQKEAQANEERSREKYLTFEEKRNALEKKKIIEKVEATKDRSIQYLKKYRHDRITEKKVENFQNIFRDVLMMQDDIQTRNVFMDVRSVTQKFPVLSNGVYAGYSILGDKSTAKTLYNSMGNVCKKQCTNLNGKKCWAKEGG